MKRNLLFHFNAKFWHFLENFEILLLRESLWDVKTKNHHGWWISKWRESNRNMTSSYDSTCQDAPHFIVVNSSFKEPFLDTVILVWPRLLTGSVSNGAKLIILCIFWDVIEWTRVQPISIMKYTLSAYYKIISSLRECFSIIKSCADLLTK